MLQAANGRWIATVELPRSPAGKRTRRRRQILPVVETGSIAMDFSVGVVSLGLPTC